MGLQTSETAWLVGGIFALLAVFLSSWEIYRHLTHWYIPSQQKWVIRVMLIVPVYAMDSWFSARFRDAATYINLVRDSYEAFVLYSFMMLVIEFIGGEKAVLRRWNTSPIKDIKLVFPFCCYRVKLGRKFLVSVKRGVLQFTLIKPSCALLALALEAIGLYGDGTFDFTTGYLYTTSINFISVSVSMYYLLLFYVGVKPFLVGFRPVSKFLCVKLIIFASFWQSVLISALVSFGAIKEVGTWTPNEIALGTQDTAICVEMFLAAIAHMFAYTYKEFKESAERLGLPFPKRTFCQKLGTLFECGDVFQDTRKTLFTRKPLDASELSEIQPPPPAATGTLGDAAPVDVDEATDEDVEEGEDPFAVEVDAPAAVPAPSESTRLLSPRATSGGGGGTTTQPRKQQKNRRKRRAKREQQQQQHGSSSGTTS